ncbi:MAG: sigma-54-dependent Fis family transcriptional regulator [Anaerovoracaceae bacterium]|jgi:transcriptional regulator of acetoin/glycerol metabolism
MAANREFHFDEEYEKVLNSTFDAFVKGQKPDLSKVRPIVAQSWIRSREYNVPYEKNPDVPILNREQCSDLQRHNRRLITAFHNHVNKIFDVMRASGYYVFLSDKDGWLLDIMTDSVIMSNFEYDPTLRVGASRHEKFVGTNAIGTCLREDAPLTLWGGEHYNYFHKNYSCAGAPIHDKKGNLIGCLSITGGKNAYQDHTLAIAISVALSIESELNSQKESMGSAHPAPRITFDDIIGESPEMIKLKNTAKQVAQTDVPILLWGESGSGKEVFATAIHNSSECSDGPFVPINCGAIPRELIESELFGYEEGAFTGARKGGKAGILETASGGTLFLDEIESMPLDAQVKLLRVLSTNMVVRIGGTTEIPVNFRVISATKQDLFEALDEGTFREDLIYRINTITLRIPPLRDRGGDRKLLAEFFLSKAMEKRNIRRYTVPDEFYELLETYDWRGNVRELHNVIEGIAAMTEEGEVLNLSVVPERIRERQSHEPLRRVETDARTEEEDCIIRALETTKGNIKAAAKNLDMPRSTLYYRIQNSQKLTNYIRKWRP